jgi:hypothetical protein
VIVASYRQSDPPAEAVRVHLEHHINGRYMIELGGGVTLYADATEADELAARFAEIADTIIAHKPAEQVA